MRPNAEMSLTADNRNPGFIWGHRLTIITGIIMAAVLAAAHFAPALTAPLEWLPH